MNRLNIWFHEYDSANSVMLGELAWQDGRTWLQLTADFVDRGLNPSPFTLDLTTGVQEAPRQPFNGLHALFHDSLPDGWGLYLMDRVFRQHGVLPDQVTPLDRLSYVGDKALGAMTFDPSRDGLTPTTDVELDIAETGEQALKMLDESLQDVADRHAVNGTPSAGARPKLLIGFDGTHAVEGAGDLPRGFSHWLIKFPTGNTPEMRCEGVIEYVYAQMAKDAGVNMSETCLIAGTERNAYFATRRFDRGTEGRRVHVQCVAALLGIDFRIPNFEYVELFRLSDQLTNSYTEKLHLFRQMVFNVVTGNRDDHTRNFAFMYNDDMDWVCTPAFDVTWNSGISGEHTMTVNGKGKNIVFNDIIEVAKRSSIASRDVRVVIDQVISAVSQWNDLAAEHEIPSDYRREIGDYHSARQRAMSPTSISV